MERIAFKDSDGIPLSGILSNRDSKTIVILCHGFTSSKESRTNMCLEHILNDHDIATFRFDFFGHGESGGNLEDVAVSKAVDGILQAITLVKQKGYSRIGLVGSSFGGIASIIAASKSEDIEILALKSPVSHYKEKKIQQMELGELDEWKKKGWIHYMTNEGAKKRLNYAFFEDFAKNNGYKAAEKIKIPVLIFHGDKDEIVPVEQSRKTAKILENCRLEIIQGADHSYTRKEDFNLAIEKISGFLIECLAAKSV